MAYNSLAYVNRLPEPQLFDNTNQMRLFGQGEQDQRQAEAYGAQRAAGQRMAQGDTKGAAQAAYAGGDVQLGASLEDMIHKMDDAKRAHQERAFAMLGQLAASSENNPAMWSKVIAGLRSQGYNVGREFDDPAQGPALAKALAGKWAEGMSSYQKASLGLQQQELQLRRDQLDQSKYAVNPATGEMYDTKTGQVVPGQGGAPRQGKPPTEAQSNAAFWASRMGRAEGDYQGVVQPGADGTPQGYDPASRAFEASAILGTITAGILGGNDSYFNGQGWRQYQSAAREWIAAMLRKDTGAAVTTGEMQMYFPTYFPQAGDSPATMAAKQKKREAVQQEMMAVAGPGWDAFQARMPQQSGGPAGGGPQRFRWNPATGEIE